jgi:hypothetical protein
MDSENLFHEAATPERPKGAIALIVSHWPILRVAVGAFSRKLNGCQGLENRHSQHDRAVISGKEQLRPKKDT